MLKWIQGILGKKVDYAELIRQGATILDVRTPIEFKQGHVKGSVNIPLQDLARQLNKLRDKGKPVIACCATGNRSGTAARMLRNIGVEAYNGGSWRSLVKYRA